ncbi:hypothetical protein Ct61P_15099 [Colletotrichum tofieldiae]|nr:hypothetical protein Ct61P_15099 [Colletotrichum tofieldiae]
MVLSRSGYSSDRDYFQDLITRGARTEYCEPAPREAFNMHVLIFDAESIAPTTITSLSNKDSLPSRAAGLDPGLVAKKLDEIQPHLQAWKNGKFAPAGLTTVLSLTWAALAGGPFRGWPYNTENPRSAPGSPTMARVPPPARQHRPRRKPRAGGGDDVGGDALCLEQLRAIVSSLENTLNRAGPSTAVASGNRQQPSKGKPRGKKGEAGNAAGNAG